VRGSSINGFDDHPVVHVAYTDAEAYACLVSKEEGPTDTEETGPLTGYTRWMGTPAYARRGKPSAWVVSKLILAGNSRPMLKRRDISGAPNVSSA
jgi:hypothetical protein